MSDIKDPRFVSSMFPLVNTQGEIGFDNIERGEIRKIINSHLKMLLLTNPGELISDSSFGVGLYTYLFLLENEPKVLALEDKINSQIRRYLDYLEDFLVEVDTSKVTEHKIAVRISYVITRELRADTITFVVDEGSAVMVEDPSTGSSTVSLGDVLGERA